jgi:hypothetical protein
MNPLIPGVGLGYLILFVIVFLIMRTSPSPRRLQKLVNAVGLPLTADLEPDILAATRVEQRSTILVTAGSILVAGVILGLTHTNAFLPILWGYTMLVLAGTAVGALLSTFRGERRRQARAIRFARAKAVSMSDYVSALDQWAPRIVVALFVGGLAVRCALTPHLTRDVPVFLFVYAAFAIATLVFSEVARRTILAHGQPAGSDLELAWDDALKGRALWSLTVAPLYLAGYGGLMTGAFSTAGAENVRATFAALAEEGISLIALLFMLVVIILWSASSYQKRYLRRLWPEFAVATGATPTAPTALAAP